MQTQAQAERVAYANELAAAARHMEASEEPLPVRCESCAHFHRFSTEDRWAMVSQLPDGTENRMYVCKAVCDSMGVCDLRFDDIGGFVYPSDYAECDEEEGYEEVGV